MTTLDVLIIGRATDPHIGSVAGALDRAGLSHACVDQADVASLETSFSPAEGRLRIGERELLGARLIWVRRLHPPVLGRLADGDARFARQEFGALLLGGLASWEPEWHSWPATLRHAAHKPLQIAMASRDPRLNVPATLITSSPAEARRFMADVGGRFIAKSVEAQLIPTDEGYDSLFTLPVDDELLDDLDSLRLSPCIFQQRIDRRFDVRLNVVGERVFATRIDTSSFEEAATDSRRAYYGDVPHEVIDPPDDVAHACVGMCTALDISFGAFDFAVDALGRWYFLEINPWGQWAWIEDMTGQPIGEAFAAMFQNRIAAR